MNTQRITISLPNYLYTQVKATTNKGHLSRFVANAIENTLLEEKTTAIDPIEDFLSLKKTLNLPKRNWKQIKTAIEKGRT